MRPGNGTRREESPFMMEEMAMDVYSDSVSSGG
jgi:hypothetical protein